MKRRLPWSLFVRRFILLMVVVSLSSIVYVKASGGEGQILQPSTSTRSDDSSIFEDTVWLIDIMDAIGEGSGSDVTLTAINFGVIPVEVDVLAEDVTRYLLTGVKDQTLMPTTDIHIDHIEVISQYEASGMVPFGEKSTLSVSVKQDDRAKKMYVIVEVYSTGLEKHEVYQEWLREIDERWTELGLQTDWRMNLQANLKQNLPPDTLWHVLEDAGARAAGEEYTDGRSSSRTYEVPGLHRSVVVDGQVINLQAAIHHLLIEGPERYRITLGTPLITIEY